MSDCDDFLFADWQRIGGPRAPWQRVVTGDDAAEVRRRLYAQAPKDADTVVLPRKAVPGPPPAPRKKGGNNPDWFEDYPLSKTGP